MKRFTSTNSQNSISTHLDPVKATKYVVKNAAKLAVLEEFPETEPLFELLSGSESEAETMKKGGKKNRKIRRTNGRKGHRNTNAYLRPERIHVRDIIPWSEPKGTKNRWNYHITLGSLIAPFVKVYDEFRVLNLKVKFFADAPERGATGCYTGILMDQNGFGDFGAATGAAWFKSIGCFPESVIRHREEPISLSWGPTELLSREWRRGDAEKYYVVASLYFADDGEQETEVGGTLLITGKILARGRWYNIPTVAATRVGEQMRNASIDDALAACTSYHYLRWEYSAFVQVYPA